jgi:hypothetical protein
MYTHQAGAKVIDGPSISNKVQAQPRMSSILDRLRKADSEFGENLNQVCKKVMVLHNSPSSVTRVGVDDQRKEEDEKGDVLGEFEKTIRRIEMLNAQLSDLNTIIGEIV